MNGLNPKRSAAFLLAFAAAGLASGTLLGLTLKAAQDLSGHRVYRLLLNADYVPVLKQFRLTEVTEFVIHLFISAALCLILGWIWQKRADRRMPSTASMIGVTALIGVVVGLLLYPTTLLSAGGTPPIDSLPAWAWWLAAHLLYGAASGLLLRAVLLAQRPRRRM